MLLYRDCLHPCFLHILNFYVSQKETYLGYKVHALIIFDGFIKTFELTSASIDARKALPDSVENQGSW